MRTVLKALTAKLGIRPEEVGILAFSWLYVVVLFMAYYVLRPIRDEPADIKADIEAVKKAFGK